MHLLSTGGRLLKYKMLRHSDIFNKTDGIKLMIFFSNSVPPHRIAVECDNQRFSHTCTCMSNRGPVFRGGSV